ncbi:MAG: hypothetical protein I3270_01540 [Candidatus Moeniiplasma glomeromycotorum]|nr:hypothetical protein [Candidatus Moeniiplasma glomeromycotorum]MCE8162390.1 hypothetical protein [Candidatus Moeniiplasma glomeromycotorum]MCE8166315.1 hypothetical protein [Candidatus Moeniiplasma glomeromycotorum]MCE8166797.1 hypothetical protein [Candidatus Moeniiplasma glomeromycotorum]
MKQGGGFIKGKPTGVLKMNNNNQQDKDREPTIRELEEQLRRKKLKEELAKKANKQSRDYDESMLGVCHTCHVPIYYGEPIHKLQTRDDETVYTGIAGGGYSGEAGIGGAGWRAKKKSHTELEGWIQCGFCYGSFKEEMATLKKWESEWLKWGLIIGIPFAIIGSVAGYFLVKDMNANTNPVQGNNPGGAGLGSVLLAGFMAYCLGAFIGGMIWRWKRGKKPEPDRYKIRKNPYRDTLIWKLDNEGNPVKEGSSQVNKYGMILDPERDKVPSAEQRDKIIKNGSKK